MKFKINPSTTTLSFKKINKIKTLDEKPRHKHIGTTFTFFLNDITLTLYVPL